MEAEKLDKTEMKLDEDQIKFSYNESLLKEASEIKTERQLLKERLEKLEQAKSTVSVAVYAKVYTDYSTQLDESTQRLMALKRDLDKEEKALSEKKVLIEKQIKSHKEAKEENQLRCTLGEMTQEKADELNQTHAEETSRLDKALHLLNDAIERHRAIFAGEVKKEVLPPHITSEPTPIPEKKPVLKAVPPPVETPSISEKQVSSHTDRIDLREPHTETALKEPSISTSVKTPRVAEQAPELLVFENGKQTQKLSVNKTIVIGRSPASDVVVREAKVSRKHAEIQIVGDQYRLIDLESSNGTFVGGKKITEHLLQPGDEISVGSLKLKFQTS